MQTDLLILIVEALAVYLLVLGTHSLRRRFGLAHFYAFLGSITALMSWITDANVRVEVSGMTFMVGSTVFYTSLLLGVFVVYVFDGPRATRIAISTVAGVSALVPLVALALHLQMTVTGHGTLGYVPIPSLRINTASVVTTVVDLVFLAMAWEFLGKSTWKLKLWLRAFLTLLGVMWLDVILFSTGAFLGTADYLPIMKGTLISRFVVSVFAFPLLYAYLRWHNRKSGVAIENRPVMAILREVAEVRHQLGVAEREIQQRKKVEREKEQIIEKLKESLARVRQLEGLLPICSGCHKIRLEGDREGNPDQWISLESYVRDRTDLQFSHSLCEECLRKHYPGVAEDILTRMHDGNDTPQDTDGE